MAEILSWWEKIKKYKHGKNYHDQQKKKSTFVISVNGFLGREALVVLANLSRLMAAKMDKPISHVRGWVNCQIKIAAARLYSQMIHIDQLPSPLRYREPYWDPASGLILEH